MLLLRTYYCVVSILMLLCLHCTAATFFHVKPDYGNEVYGCVHCKTITYYVSKQLESNSVLNFSSGMFLLNTDFIIHDLHNISLIGTSNATNSTSNTIIQCNSPVSVVMINITSLTIKNIVIKNCGPFSSVPVYIGKDTTIYRQAVTIYNCSFVHLTNVNICAVNANHGLLIINAMGSNFLDKITSVGVLIVYNHTKNPNNYIKINSYYFVGITSSQKFRIILLLENNATVVSVSISDTVIVSKQKLHFMLVKFFHYSAKVNNQYSIMFANCCFGENEIDSIVTIVGAKISSCPIKFLISLTNSLIMNNTFTSSGHIVKTILGNVKYFVNFSSCLFHKNIDLKLITFFTAESFLCSKDSEVYIGNSTFSFNHNLDASMINASQAKLSLDGPVLFTGIESHIRFIALTIFSVTPALRLHGFIGIFDNYMLEFIHFTGKCSYQNILLENNTNFVFERNIIASSFVACDPSTKKWIREPHTLCIFQFNCSLPNSERAINNLDDKFFNYSILFENNSMGILVNYYQPIYYTHCSWLSNSIFHNLIPLEVNQRFISFSNSNYQHWSFKKKICICHNNSHYDCNNWTHLSW